MYTKLNKTMLTSFQNNIVEAMNTNKVPGLALTLIENNEIALNKCYGLKKSSCNLEVDNNTIFEAASLTKPLVALAALMLCDKGVMNLDIPLSKYLKEEYLKEEPLSKLITTRHVLSHSGGFPNWAGKEKLWVQFNPGEKFCYSGEGFVYLQKVIEEITSEPLDVHIKKNIFIPFGMPNSSLVWIDKYEELAAYPHDEAGNAGELRRSVEPNAAWSLYTTSYEYCKFILGIINADKHLASDITNEIYKSRVKVNEYISWGLGWGIEHRNTGDLCWHWGHNGEYKAFTTFDKYEKSGIVIMTNGANGLKVCRDIISHVLGDHNVFDKFLDGFYRE